MTEEAAKLGWNQRKSGDFATCVMLTRKLGWNQRKSGDFATCVMLTTKSHITSVVVQVTYIGSDFFIT